MIVNFFLDHRVGGPHIYSTYLKKKFKNYKFLNCTSGESKISEINLINLRLISKFLFPLEILLNFFQIILNKKINKKEIFFVFTVFNLAPILSGFFLKKKIFWFILEPPNLFLSYIIKILNHNPKITVVTINKNLIKNLKISKFKIFYPNIDTFFWNRKKKLNKNYKIITISIVGNINKLKNHLMILKFLSYINTNTKLNINIIGEKLENQKEYFLKIQSEINILRKQNKKVKIYGRRKSSFIKKILNKSDIFLLPSLTEGMSIALLEAMSMKCICLVSSNSNKSNIIRNKKNGLIFELNFNSFRKIFEYYLNLNTSQLRLISNNARNTIIKLNEKSKNLNI